MKKSKNDIVKPNNEPETTVENSTFEQKSASGDSPSAKEKKATPKIPANQVDFERGTRGGNFVDNIVADSEDGYRRVVEKIVGITDNELQNQSTSKNPIKKKFTTFFVWFISIQYIALIIVLVLLGFSLIKLSETIIITYMTSVFAETLGAVIIMIRYAFNSKQEVELIKILSSAITDYKKFNE